MHLARRLDQHRFEQPVTVGSKPKSSEKFIVARGTNATACEVRSDRSTSTLDDLSKGVEECFHTPESTLTLRH